MHSHPPINPQTLYGAQGAPQHCPILHTSKSKLSVTRIKSDFNVQSMRKKCQILAAELSNFSGASVKHIAVRV